MNAGWCLRGAQTLITSSDLCMVTAVLRKTGVQTVMLCDLYRSGDSFIHVYYENLTESLLMFLMTRVFLYKMSAVVKADRESFYSLFKIVCMV